jgi:low affinity Fe/Cu permease
MLNEIFRRFASKAAEIVGSSWTFLAAVLTILTWAVTGPFFHYSDTWQLAINTGTSVVTFMMVFLIQHSQNRDTKAIHLKLAELIRAVEEARTELVNLEDFSDQKLQDLKEQFEQIPGVEVAGEPADGGS